MNHRTSMWGVVAVASMTLIAGCGQGDESAAPPPSEQVATAQISDAPSAMPENPPPAAAGSPGLPVAATLQALQVAAQAVPNGRPFELEVEIRDGQRVFDMEVASNGNAFDVVVDATGTQVVTQSLEGTSDDDVRKVEAASVDAGRALQTAADREGDAAVEELKIDTDDGVLVWEIDLVRADGTEVEIEVDAQNGTIR